jgi:hypothetical protein
MLKQFLHFDEIEDVLSSLDLLGLVAPLVSEQPSYWKWAIIAAHGGLQGAMVCALRDSSGVSVLEKECAREMLEWFNTQKGMPPQERLADFNTLLTRCRKSGYMDGKPLSLSHAQAKDIKSLHKHFRNNFVHFTPKSWCIEKAGLPRIVCAAVDSIETLMGHPRVLYKFSGNMKRRLAHRLKVVQARLA